MSLPHGYDTRAADRCYARTRSEDAGKVTASPRPCDVETDV